MRRLPILTVIIALLSFAASADAAVPSGGTLYVQQAAGGTLTKTPSGSWRLALRDPGLRTTSFADRPSRRAGSLPLGSFVSSWTQTFGQDAPNAALEISDGPPSRDVVLLELSRPRYERRRGLLVFSVRPLKSSADPALRAITRRADRGVHGSFGRASLFIDDGDEGNLLTFSFRGLGSSPVEIGLSSNHFLFSPPASYLSETAGIVWSGEDSLLTALCHLASGCDGRATVAVDAPADEPLEGVVFMPEVGTVSASWAGGPTTTFPAGGAIPFSLVPAHP